MSNAFESLRRIGVTGKHVSDIWRRKSDGRHYVYLANGGDRSVLPKILNTLGRNTVVEFERVQNRAESQNPQDFEKVEKHLPGEHSQLKHAGDQVSRRGVILDTEDISEFSDSGLKDLFRDVNTTWDDKRKEVAGKIAYDWIVDPASRSKYMVNKAFKHNGETVGMLSYTRAPSQRSLYVVGFATKRKGYALSILNLVAVDAVRLNKEVILYPNDENARQFYRACGFEGHGAEMIWSVDNARKFTEYRGA